MNSALESNGNRTDQMEERTSHMEEKNLEMIQVKEERELSFLFFFF